MQSYFIQDINPIAFQFWLIKIHWYGLAYLGGFIAGYFVLKFIIKKENLVYINKYKIADLLVYLAFGVILGGRIGEVLFYSPSYYLHNPLQIFAVWNGGMSSHGGMIGVLIAIYLFAKKNSINVLCLLDAVVVATPIGLFFGRVANFINSELIGKITYLPWAVIFPTYDHFPRHPVQLYQAITEGVILLIILLIFPYKKFHIGSRTALFMIAYGIMRLITEYFRAVDSDYLGYLWGFTTGQFLSIGLIVLGFFLFFYSFYQCKANKFTYL